jgi:3-oxoacyl-[acyl-carrier protein] reductase
MIRDKFAHKTAIVTGAGSGIGLEISRRLLEEGASVVLNEIDGELCKNAIAQLSEEYSDRVRIEIGDAGELEVIKKLVATAKEKFGHLDLTVANAGLTKFGDFFTFTLKDFQEVMRLNLQGSFFLAQEAAKLMKAQEKGGSILLMSSVIGMQAYPNLTAYAMSKAAISMMARSLVLPLSPHQITINAIAPGATVTPRTLEEDPNYEAIWQNVIPLNKTAKTRDIADAALFLLSEQGRHITGQTLVIDGGWTTVGNLPSSS